MPNASASTAARARAEAISELFAPRDAALMHSRSQSLGIMMIFETGGAQPWQVPRNLAVRHRRGGLMGSSEEPV
eukprot:4898485-Pyramimonas_sp.AAC.1